MGNSVVFAKRDKISGFFFFSINSGFIVFNECRVSKHQHMDELTTKKLSLNVGKTDFPISLAHEKE